MSGFVTVPEPVQVPGLTHLRTGKVRDLYSNTSGDLVLGDEVFTPDSSRYRPADEWQPGRPQPSFDEQVLRDWLTSSASGWDRASKTPSPELPDDVVERTRSRYKETYERLTGTKPAL